MVKIKKSKKAIRYLFEDKYFYKFIDQYFNGIDPYDPTSWKINPNWGFDVYYFKMDEEGATKVNHIKNNSGSFSLNITQKDDNMFQILLINKEYGGIIQWILDIVGLKYEDMKNFDPYKYNVFNEYITRNG